jgi:hypothetical protein
VSDETWFVTHPHRRHRVRKLFPVVDELNCIVPGAPGPCGCPVPHEWVMVLRHIGGGRSVGIRLPSTDCWPPDDERKLEAIFDCFVRKDPRVWAAYVKAIAETEGKP